MRNTFRVGTREGSGPEKRPKIAGRERTGAGQGRGRSRGPAKARSGAVGEWGAEPATAGSEYGAGYDGGPEVCALVAA